MISPSRRISLALAVGCGFAPGLARGQGTPPTTSGDTEASGGVGGAGVAPPNAPDQAPSPPSTANAPLSQPGPFGNPQSPNGTIGGGNATESSAHPVTGDQEDTFDLAGGAGRAAAAAHGSANSPIFAGRSTFGGEPPNSHLVRRGETLWGLCDFYFRNPYEWPRIWSYNAQIKNPNWIYPGDEVHLKPAGEAVGTTPSPNRKNQPSFVNRRRTVSKDTVFLRDQGWIHDPSDDIWGELTGAEADKTFLSDLDEVYLTLKKGHDVQIGQELTIFRTRTTVAAGAIVQVLGTVRVDGWNPDEHVARAKVVETLDVIERGAKVGPVARSFEVVPSRRNEADVEAHVVASLHPNEFFGQNQVVFIDKGENAGLAPGNRLFVVRKGDAWRQTLVTADVGFRVSADDERPMPPMERTPGSTGDDAHYPNEDVAELRVIDVKSESAACLVTQSKVEIELKDVAVARKGY